MGNGWALQDGTSHFLGQNFSRVFETKFLNDRNELEYIWQTSWGVSTRMVGSIIMVHGDDQGLVLPPRMAPIQVVIVPIWKSDEERAAVLGAVQQVQAALPGIRIRLDDRDGLTPGFKFNDWEMRGVPLRVEIGPRDVAAGQVLVARRDRVGEKKQPLPLAGLAERLPALLDEIQRDLFDRAVRFRTERTFYPTTYAELGEAVERGFAWAWWCGSRACEDKIKGDTKATSRNIPLQQPGGTGRCIVCGEQAAEQAVFARAY